MAFQVSPGVQVNEIDATNVVPAVSTALVDLQARSTGVQWEK